MDLNGLKKCLALAGVVGLAACGVDGGDSTLPERDQSVPVIVGQQVCAGGNCDQAAQQQEAEPFQQADACHSEGARRCAADVDGYQQCLRDPDTGVLDWSLQIMCGDGLTCIMGECVLLGTECQDQCAAGARECVAEAVYRTCGDFDEDDCSEWSDFVQCPGNQTCSNGECLWTCMDECAPGDSRCSPTENAYQLCDDHDDDPCFEWSYPWPCFGGETCSQGECTGFCEDECAVGQQACGPDASVRICGHYDIDACADWSSPVSCDPGDTCIEGQCKALPDVWLDFKTPGPVCGMSVTLSVVAKGAIVEVLYFAGGAFIAGSKDVANDFAVTYVFGSAGGWDLYAAGYDDKGSVLAETQRSVQVEPTVPR